MSTSTRSERDRRPRRSCRGCGTRTRSLTQVCAECASTLAGGRWVHDLGGVRRWVPNGESLLSYTERRRAYKAARAERYAAPRWWAKPALVSAEALADDDLSCARRRRDALAEVYAVEAREVVA